MLIQAAEASYKKGLGAQSGGRVLEAVAFFEAALELEKRFGATPPQARYLSHYGLCLGLTRHRFHEAADLCRGAIDLEPFNADLHWNLGRLMLFADRKREAHNALHNGLGIHPEHKGILDTVRGMGSRRRPPLPFLARSHPLNVMLGRMRN